MHQKIPTSRYSIILSQKWHKLMHGWIYTLKVTTLCIQNLRNSKSGNSKLLEWYQTTRSHLCAKEGQKLKQNKSKPSLIKFIAFYVK